MSPEDRIQAAWVQRAAADLDAKRAQGLAAHQTSWPVWAPEVAVQALRDAGLLNVGGSPVAAGSSAESAVSFSFSAPGETHPSSCNCPPDPDRVDGMRWEAGICGAARPLTPDEFAAFDAISDELKEMSALEQAMRDAADEGEWGVGA